VIGHVGYAIDGAPYVTPTVYWREDDRLYWHGAAASRLCRGRSQDLSVCVTVTHLDGLVLARSAFAHTLLYRSVMAFGRATVVEDSVEKRRVLDRLIDRLYPGRAGEVRAPSEPELNATVVMAMAIEEASAKIKAGGVIDRDDDLDLPIWAGVVPIEQRIGRIVPDPRLVVAPTPPPSLDLYRENAVLDQVLGRTDAGSA